MQDEIKQGRPRIYTGEGAPLQTATIRLSVWHVRAARRIGQGNASEGIRLAIERADSGCDTIAKPVRQS